MTICFEIKIKRDSRTSTSALNNPCIPKMDCEEHGGLMGSALVSRSSGLVSSPGRGLCVVLLGKTLYSHSASSTQVYKWVPDNLMQWGVALRWTSIPSRGE